MDTSKTISIKRAAEILHVNRKHIYKLIERDQLHPVRREVYRKHGPVDIPLSEVLSLLPEGEREAARARLG